VRISGLPLSLEPGSLRARVVNGPPGLAVIGVRPTFDVELAEEVDVPLEARQLEQARDAAAALRVALARVESDIKELEALRPRFREPKPGEPPRAAAVSSLVALADFATTQLSERFARRRELKRQLDDAEEQVRLRERRLAEAGTARRSERARTSRAAVVTLSGPASAPAELAIEYRVPGARWAPAYDLRMDRALSDGVLRMRASVAQRTGEDWSGVRLSLSTASLQRRADVPELRSLRIGREQAEPRRAGFREPPPGLDDLFASWDEAMRAGPALGAEARAQPRKKADVDRHARRARPIEDDQRPRGAAPRAPRGEVRSIGDFLTLGPSEPITAAPPESAAAGLPASAQRRSMPQLGAPPGGVLRAAADALGLTADHAPPEASPAMMGDEEAASMVLAAPEAPEAAVVAEHTLAATLLDYDRLHLGAPDAGAQRGRLRPAAEHDVAVGIGISVDVEVIVRVMARARVEAMSVAQLAVPAGCRPAASLDGFDYRYDCAARADVPSTGGWVSVPVMTCDVGLVPEFVCVPAVDPQVYRTVLVKNTSQHALLTGPCDVSAGDEFLVTAQLPAIPPGGDTQRLGLGVDEAIKVARHTRFRETSGGLFGGATLLVHDVDIEINNRLASPVTLQVRERVPVVQAGEKHVEIEEGDIRPPWDKVDEPVDGAVVAGTRRWRVTAGAGERTSLAAQYTIRIPGDRMLVGGNRRG
jgi:hypothetical protein